MNIIFVQAYMGVCTIQTWYAGSCGILSPSQGWQQNHANHITAGLILSPSQGWRQKNHANHTTAG